MSSRILTGVLAATAALVLAAPAIAASPGAVTVRVEGAADTLVPSTRITTTTTPVTKDGHQCSGTSAGGALDQVTGGDWSGWDDSFGAFTVTVVKGESHPFSSSLYWGVYVNDVLASVGVCDAELQPGDDLLFAPDNTPGNGSPKAVLRLTEVPPSAVPGVAFVVKVVATTTTFDSSPPYLSHVATVPAAGATVAGGGASATTGPDGLAQLTLNQRGSATVRATRGGDIRSASLPVCVTTGSDGACGTTPKAPCATNGRDGLCGTRDLTAPLASILGIREGQRFTRGQGPRTLRGAVSSDPSGLLMVKLRLTRNDHGRCATFSATRDRFVKRRCGATHGWWFRIGDRADWSFLLPSRPAAGRYVLDVDAIDRAHNRDDARVRGRNRMVFTVG